VHASPAPLVKQDLNPCRPSPNSLHLTIFSRYHDSRLNHALASVAPYDSCNYVSPSRQHRQSERTSLSLFVPTKAAFESLTHSHITK
jgi:hypothetical protein